MLTAPILTLGQQEATSLRLPHGKAVYAAFCLQIIVTSTTAFLVAGRFGLAPTVRQQASSGLRLVDNGTKGLSTGDPSGTLNSVTVI